MLAEEVIISLPNQMTIHTLRNLLQKQRFFPGLVSKFVLGFHPTAAFFHPMMLAMLAAWGNHWREQGVPIECRNTDSRGTRYARRMGLFEHLCCDSVLGDAGSESAGKFVPLHLLTTREAAGAFVAEVPPLLHRPGRSDAVTACLQELVRNVFEHAGSVPALACAQYYPKASRISIGVADCGIGIRKSLSWLHPVKDDLDALYWAVRPGVSGAVRTMYGGNDNAGAGLFFTKSMAHASGGYFALVSGSAAFRLRRNRDSGPLVLAADPKEDRHDPLERFSPWKGTALGVDIGLFDSDRMKEVVDLICSQMVRPKKQAAVRFT